jgi:thymidylate synthase (FAD)
MSEPIKVLDHGFVRLVDHMGSDLSIVRAARVSHNAAWRAGEDAGKDEALIRYMMNNDHTTPFEAVEFQFEVKLPIFVARQWHRHRTWTYNEISGRYAELPKEFYVPRASKVGAQSTSDKQARDYVNDLDTETWIKRRGEANDYRLTCEEAFDEYLKLLGDGWPRELARGILPVATYTHMLAKVDLHNLLHFIGLRHNNHAQYEIRIYAQAMLDLARPIVPVAIAAWEEKRARLARAQRCLADFEKIVGLLQPIIDAVNDHDEYLDRCDYAVRANVVTIPIENARELRALVEERKKL